MIREIVSTGYVCTWNTWWLSAGHRCSMASISDSRTTHIMGPFQFLCNWSKAFAQPWPCSSTGPSSSMIFNRKGRCFSNRKGR